MSGETVTAPDGTQITLVGVGTETIWEDDDIRVWDVSLQSGGMHPWHKHHNPYVVLSILGSSGHMDWLEGHPRREISEYTGGSVFRPVSPIHRLTITGASDYRNRLVELKGLGENNPGGVVDVGQGARSQEGQTIGPTLADGRIPVIESPEVRVWTVLLQPGEQTELDSGGVGLLIAELDDSLEGDDLKSSIDRSTGLPYQLRNDSQHDRTWFVIALDYLEENTHE